VVEAVGAHLAPAVGDDDGDVALQRALEDVGQLVHRLAHELGEVVVVVGIEVEELGLVRLREGAVLRQALRPADDAPTAEPWTRALERTDGPTALIFSRQSLPQLDPTTFAADDEIWTVR
jgi:hypothetical protein